MVGDKDKVGWDGREGKGRERACIYRKDSSREALRSNTGARRELLDRDQEDDRQPDIRPILIKNIALAAMVHPFRTEFTLARLGRLR